MSLYSEFKKKIDQWQIQLRTLNQPENLINSNYLLFLHQCQTHIETLMQLMDFLGTRDPEKTNAKIIESILKIYKIIDFLLTNGQFNFTDLIADASQLVARISFHSEFKVQQKIVISLKKLYLNYEYLYMNTKGSFGTFCNAIAELKGKHTIEFCDLSRVELCGFSNKKLSSFQGLLSNVVEIDLSKNKLSRLTLEKWKLFVTAFEGSILKSVNLRGNNLGSSPQKLNLLFRAFVQINSLIKLNLAKNNLGTLIKETDRVEFKAIFDEFKKLTQLIELNLSENFGARGLSLDDTNTKINLENFINSVQSINPATLFIFNYGLDIKFEILTELLKLTSGTNLNILELSKSCIFDSLDVVQLYHVLKLLKNSNVNLLRISNFLFKESFKKSEEILELSKKRDSSNNSYNKLSGLLVPGFQQLFEKLVILDLSATYLHERPNMFEIILLAIISSSIQTFGYGSNTLGCIKENGPLSTLVSYLEPTNIKHLDLKDNRLSEMDSLELWNLLFDPMLLAKLLTLDLSQNSLFSVSEVMWDSLCNTLKTKAGRPSDSGLIDIKFDFNLLCETRQTQIEEIIKNNRKLHEKTLFGEDYDDIEKERILLKNPKLIQRNSENNKNEAFLEYEDVNDIEIEIEIEECIYNILLKYMMDPKDQFNPSNSPSTLLLQVCYFLFKHRGASIFKKDNKTSPQYFFKYKETTRFPLGKNGETKNNDIEELISIYKKSNII